MKTATGRSRWRPWQFRLRTLLILLTLAAIGSSIYAWRQHRDDYLAGQVVKFNAAMDRQCYDEAEEITLAAARWYPGEPILALMLEKCRVAQHLEKGGRIGDYRPVE